MKLFERLRSELKESPAGTYAPYYFRYLGYQEALGTPPATFRAAGIYSLFTRTKPVILKSELFAGNTRCLYTQEDPVVLEYTKNRINALPKRGFSTNSDHFTPHYRKVLALGLPGMLAEVDASIEKHKAEPKKVEMLQAMKHTLLGFRQMICNYIAAAENCKQDPGYDAARMDFIITNSQAILEDKPQTFAQALQLVWYCHSAFLLEERYAMALGRLDQYLYPFYKADIEAGRITNEQVTECLENIFIRLQGDVVNICIGGRHANGDCAINELSRCILHAVNNCHVPGPNLSLRYTDNTPDDFLDECLQVLGTGLGYPAMMNNDVNVAALKRYGYAEEDVIEYTMVGCIENFITGKQPPWTDGAFPTPQYFDYIFNRGVSSVHGSIGVDTGPVEDIHSMEEFMAAFEKQLALGVAEYCTWFNNQNSSINQEQLPQPFLSCFCDDCIGRGLDINNGGAIYPSVHGAGLMGVATTADSLAAIEKVVFIDKDATLAQLRDALNADFEGYEWLQEKLLAAPKYGNNDDFVDKYAVWFVDYIPSQFALYKTRDGGGFYNNVGSNVHNVRAGKRVNATPDGRKRGVPFSDAGSPSYGRDTRGPTCTFSSLVKPDYTKLAECSVVNQKYSPSMFTDEKRGKLAALIRTYFKKGGQQLQINSTSRKVLMDAMEHPENYQDLVVRVTGFSAFYITLERDVQLDILNRTQHE